MRHDEDDLLPLSALQHFAYCPRQFALIHLEQVWVENRFTAEGQVLHQRTNSGQGETRGELHTARSLRLKSRSLGVTGIADVVEFHRDSQGVTLPGKSGRWRVFPVEYKRGRSKTEDWDRIQLCAQAICLEEMLGTEVNEGAIFYGKARRREAVVFNDDLRSKTRILSEQMHALWSEGKTPAAVHESKCQRCSLRERCMPETQGARAYLERMLET